MGTEWPKRKEPWPVSARWEKLANKHDISVKVWPKNLIIRRRDVWSCCRYRTGSLYEGRDWSPGRDPPIRVICFCYWHLFAFDASGARRRGFQHLSIDCAECRVTAHAEIATTTSTENFAQKHKSKTPTACWNDLFCEKSCGHILSSFRQMTQMTRSAWSSRCVVKLSQATPVWMEHIKLQGQICDCKKKTNKKKTLSLWLSIAFGIWHKKQCQISFC